MLGIFHSLSLSLFLYLSAKENYYSIDSLFIILMQIMVHDLNGKNNGLRFEWEKWERFDSEEKSLGR